MYEFRPAEVIERDTRLAESLAADDPEALDELAIRYGRAVSALTVLRHELADDGDAIENDVAQVFVQVWAERDRIDPGTDFAPWIARIAGATATSSTPDRVWAVAMAVDAIDVDARADLRAHHVNDDELPDDAHRHELRLRRRVSHLGDDTAVVAALSDPAPWTDPPADLAEQVRSRLAGADRTTTAASDRSAGERTSAGGSGRSDDDGDGHVVVPGRVARSLRPVLLGLAGAIAVLFVAIVALSAASGSPDPVAFTADFIPTGAIVDVEGGELTVTERDAGLQLDLDAPTLPRRAGDQYYEGVLVLSDGSELTVGTFNEGLDITLWGGVALERVDTVRIVTGDIGVDATDVVLKLDVP